MIRRRDLIERPTKTGWAASWNNSYFADCAEDETHSDGLSSPKVSNYSVVNKESDGLKIWPGSTGTARKRNLEAAVAKK